MVALGKESGVAGWRRAKLCDRAVSGLQNGCVGSGCTNVQETYVYNNRLQPSMIELSGTTNGGYCLVYNYYGSSPTSCALPSPGTTDNGNVMGYWYQDIVNSNFSHTATYNYDGVNRLATAVATPFGSGAVSYNLTFNDPSKGQGYDPYGNMTCVQNGSTNGPCPQWTYNTGTNQLTTSPCAYDAAGNLTEDCSTASNHTYQWDAEGRVASVDSGSTWSFTYNALGQRVQMAGPGGTQELMYAPNGVWLGIYGVVDLLPWGGGYFAWYDGTDTYFNHINNIASTSVLTNHAGTAVEDVLFYPWGQNTWKFWGSGGYSFAELPYYDTTTNTNLTLFRFYSTGLGRWLSPDPLGGDITNPQSLNRYAYVINNPTTFLDPSGAWFYMCNPDQGSCSLWGSPGAGGGGGAAFTGPLWDIEAQNEQPYVIGVNLAFLAQCPSCAGNSYTFGGVAYTWVPSTFSQNGNLIQISTGYWRPTDVSAVAAVGTVGLLGLELGPADIALIAATAATATGIYLYKNKDAIKHIVSQLDNAAVHINKLMTDPDRDPRNTWREQIRAFLKDARKWGNRMSPGELQDFYMKMIDAAEAAVPQD